MIATEIKVRKAGIRDIRPILDLINSYAAEGLMLSRTEFDLSENIRDFSIAVEGGRILGCGALHFYTPTTAEIRSLAVAREAGGAGIGRSIVSALEGEARDNGLEAIFAFTYVTGFFARLGFLEVERGELPLKVWKDCLRCPKFHQCDEVAVLKRLTANPSSHSFPLSFASGQEELVQLRPKSLSRS